MTPENTQTTGQPKQAGLKNFAMTVLQNALVGILVAAVLALPVRQGFIYLGKKLGPQPQLPIGTIVAWKGNGDLLPGWKICDGLNGTPNLKDLFLKGVIAAADAGKTYPSTKVYRGNLATGSQPEGVIFSEQADEQGDLPIVPQNYTVIYIMKVE